jgi:CBS domain-containing membrane protein
LAHDTNLALNIDTVGGSDNPKTVARVAVVSVSGYLRDGSAPIVSRDCANQRELGKEVERLKGELDDLLVQAGEHFEGRRREKQSKREGAGKKPAAAGAAPADKPRIRADLKVADAMTRDVKTVQRNDPLSAAEALMDGGRFRHVMVLDEHDMLAGVISHRDMFYSRLTRSMGQGKYAHEKALAALMVKQIMQTEIATVDPETALDEAAELMMTRQIGCLPVLDGDALVGILTSSDFLGILAPGDADH